MEGQNSVQDFMDSLSRDLRLDNVFPDRDPTYLTNNDDMSLPNFTFDPSFLTHEPDRLIEEMERKLQEGNASFNPRNVGSGVSPLNLGGFSMSFDVDHHAHLNHDTSRFSTGPVGEGDTEARFTKLIEQEIGAMERDLENFTRTDHPTTHQWDNAGDVYDSLNGHGVKPIDEESLLNFQTDTNDLDESPFDTSPERQSLNNASMRPSGSARQIPNTHAVYEELARSSNTGTRGFMDNAGSSRHSQQSRYGGEPVSRISLNDRNAPSDPLPLSESKMSKSKQALLSSQMTIVPEGQNKGTTQGRGSQESLEESWFEPVPKDDEMQWQTSPDFRGSADNMNAEFTDFDVDLTVPPPSEADSRTFNHSEPLQQEQPTSNSNYGPSSQNQNSQPHHQSHSPAVDLPSNLRMSMSDLFQDTTPTIRKGSTFDVANDSFHRYFPTSGARKYGTTDNSSDRAVDAFRTLQDRVGELEMEKASATGKIVELENELGRTRRHVLYEQTKLSTPEGSSDEMNGTTAVVGSSVSGKGGSVRGRESKRSKDALTRYEDDHDLYDQIKTETQLSNLRMKADLLQRQLEQSRETEAQLERDRNRAVDQLEQTRREVEELRRAMTLTEKEARDPSPVRRKETESSRPKVKSVTKKSPSPERKTTASVGTSPVRRPKAATDDQDLTPKRTTRILAAHHKSSSPDQKESAVLSNSSKRDDPPAKRSENKETTLPSALSSTKQPSQSLNRQSPTRLAGTESDASLFRKSMQATDVGASLAEDSFLLREEIDTLQREIERERVERLNHKDLHREEDMLSKPEREKLRRLVVNQLKMGKGTGKLEVRKRPVGQPSKESAKKSVPPSAPTWKKVDPGRPRTKPQTTTYSKPTSSSTAHAKSHSDRNCSCLQVPKPRPSKPKNTAQRKVAGREMPFTVGKSTTKSYSVTANIQRVFSLLKSHNPALCSVCNRGGHTATSHRHHHHHHQLEPTREAWGESKKSGADRIIRPSMRKVRDEEDHASFHEDIMDTEGGADTLRRVLRGLEQEFDELKRHYQTLVEQYETALPTSSPHIRTLGESLRQCILTMETKGDQITILREIMRDVKGEYRKDVPRVRGELRSRPTEAPRPRWDRNFGMPDDGGESTPSDQQSVDETLQHPYWRDPKPSAAGPNSVPPASTASLPGLGKSMDSLTLLKSTRKVQEALAD
ncbi:hypothetical protein DFS34DRAFT_517453 [Phlyctochytrium arcticum]|nr:hypothetical protein DFS34DRAFT_517453 [Phlyctochytrium arcticum]